MSGGRSASLQSAEQNAMQIDDEYGGHPELGAGPARISAYELRLDDGAEEEDRDPKEVEREKYGDRTNNFDLFGNAIVAPQEAAAADVDVPDLSEEDAFNAAAAEIADPVAVAPAAAEATSFAAHATAFSEAPIVPELNALEIVPLDGIREKKVREIALEVAYPKMSDDTVKRIREVFEDHAGDIPVNVTIVELPEEVQTTAGRNELRMRINHNFRVQPGPAFTAALLKLHVNARYVF
jgi:hypothetical protein